MSGRSSRKKGIICGTVYIVSPFDVDKDLLYTQAANVDNQDQFDRGLIQSRVFSYYPNLKPDV